MENTKLFVGGIAWATTEDALRAAFEAVGEVVEAKIITDKFSGKSRGFAFVTMKTAEDAKKAIEQLDGSDLDGRTIKVNEARPREE